MRAKVAATLLAIILASSFLLFTGTQTACADSRIVFQDDFEGTWPGPWICSDKNSACGYDFWGVSSNRSFGGSYSAWCAQVGNYSENGVANSINHYYDQSMDADMIASFGSLSAYDSAHLYFNYWAVTGSWSLADHLDVRVWDGFTWTTIWTQPDVTSGGWQLASLPIPTNSSKISFFFFSEDTVGLGPYEGVYIDSIVIAGNDETPPVSSVGSMPSYVNSTLVPVPFTSSDTGGAVVAYLELFSRKGTAGTFTKYAPSSNPSGHWTVGPILFDISSSGGDGPYAFYTVATDSLGNTEQPPSVPDATVVVDTSPPSTSLGLAGVPGSPGWYKGEVHATLSTGDATSGVHKTFFSLDSGAFSEYSVPVVVFADGIHNLSYYSTDKAGNVEPTHSWIVRIDKTAPTIAIHQTNGSIFTSGSVSMSWRCEDSVGGINGTAILDNGTPYTFGGHGTAGSGSALDTTITLSGLTDGQHVLVVRAIDDAGNVAEHSLSFKVDTNLLSPTGPMGAIPLVLLVVVLILAGVAVVYFLRKRGG